MPAESRVGAEGGASDAAPDRATDASDAAEDADAAERDDTAPSDAFQALGSETRLDVVRALAADQPLAFSDLFDSTDEDTSAGFAYHLRQLTDRFVRQRGDERYELTDAGRAVARSARAGTYTESVYRDPVDLDDDCPFCGATALVATVSDNVTEIACDACNRPLLGLSLPPGGYADHEGDDLADALDAHHRRRIESFAGGVCPECAGAVRGSVETADPEGAPPDPEGAPPDAEVAPPADDDVDAERNQECVPVQAAFECETCGSSLRCPVSLAVLDHPAVVAFYHDHDEDVSERPIWNVGSEWRERTVSRDPWCVLVSARLGGEDLRLYVAGDGTVVDHSRHLVEDAVTTDTAGRGANGTEGDDGDDDDDPDGGSPSAKPGGRSDGDEDGDDAAGDEERLTAEDAEVTDPSTTADGATA